MFKRIMFLSVILVLASCNHPIPVLNIVNEPIVTASGKTPSIEQIKQVIRKGVISKTWSVDEISDKEIKAHFSKGSKIARITIVFDEAEYSIRYISSEKLLYDGTNIHNRYNAWIKGLRKRINVYMLEL